jgi:hypothetical protein
MPGHFKTRSQEQREYLKTGCWASSKIYRTCRGSTDLPHLVHIDDCSAVCSLCAGQSISKVKPRIIEQEIDPEAADILEHLKFPCFEGAVDTPSITNAYVASITNIKNNPVLLPKGSILLVNRFNDTSGIEESVPLFGHLVLVTKRADKETTYEQFTEIPIYGGTLLEICRGIILYYQAMGKFIISPRIEIDGIFHVQDNKYGCIVRAS